MNLSNIIFNTKILKNKIISVKDKNKAVNSLLEMITDNTANLSKEHQAYINYELWDITKKLDYKDKAFELYMEMYKQTPKVLYKNRIDELKSI
jgi:molecular chaperone DnaK (HSP70)